MTQWFVMYVAMWANQIFSPGMHLVQDENACKKQGDAYIAQMEVKGYGANKNSWASYQCIELPYNGRI